MTNYRVPKPSNEPILGYLPNSMELITLQDTLERMSSTTIKMPLIIGGERIHTEEVGTSIIPHQKEQILGSFSMASSDIKFSSIGNGGKPTSLRFLFSCSKRCRCSFASVSS